MQAEWALEPVRMPILWFAGRGLWVIGKRVHFKPTLMRPCGVGQFNLNGRPSQTQKKYCTVHLALYCASIEAEQLLHRAQRQLRPEACRRL